MNEPLDLTLDDFSERQRTIVEVIGIDKYIELSKAFGGGSDLYIMKYDELKKISNDKKLLREFNGHNYKELASKYGYCLKTVYNKILSHQRSGGES